MPMPYSCPVCLFARIYIRSVRLNLPLIEANGEEGVIFDIILKFCVSISVDTITCLPPHLLRFNDWARNERKEWWQFVAEHCEMGGHLRNKIYKISAAGKEIFSIYLFVVLCFILVL